MIIISPDKQVGYVHTPKTGSRTMLGLFALLSEPNLYEEHPEYFEYTKPKRDARYGDVRTIAEHNHGDRNMMGWDAHRWQSHPDRHTPYRICIVRDPVKRFISGYTNRVVHYEQVPDKPDFDTFVENFEHYYETNGDIKMHFAPQHQFIGDYPTFYTNIFDTSNFEQVFNFFENVFQREFPRFRLQQGGNDTKIEPTEEQIAKIKQFYELDYSFYIDKLS